MPKNLELLASIRDTLDCFDFPTHGYDNYEFWLWQQVVNAGFRYKELGFQTDSGAAELLTELAHLPQFPVIQTAVYAAMKADGVVYSEWIEFETRYWNEGIQAVHSPFKEVM